MCYVKHYVAHLLYNQITFNNHKSGGDEMTQKPPSNANLVESAVNRYAYDPTLCGNQLEFICPNCLQRRKFGIVFVHTHDCCLFEQEYRPCIAVFGPKLVRKAIKIYRKTGEEHVELSRMTDRFRFYSMHEKLTYHFLRTNFPTVLKLVGKKKKKKGKRKQH